MKLLFDESLSSRLALLLRDLFPGSKVPVETGLLAPAITGFWTTPPLTTSFWSRPTAISENWHGKSLASRSSFFVPVII
jgi:hypothetical protein